MQNKSINRFIYYVIELLYAFVTCVFLIFLTNTYSVNSHYETQMLISVICMAVFLILLFGPGLNRYVILLYAGIISIYFITQSIYNRAFEGYYRFGLAISLFNDVLAFKDSATQFATINDFIPLIILLSITVLFIFLYYKFQKNTVSFKEGLVLRLASFLLLIPTFTVRKNMINEIDETKIGEAFQLNKTDYYLYHIIPDASLFREKFGLLNFGVRDFESFFEKNDIDENEINEIREFLNSKPKHTENEMTGLFKDKNVIFIQAESFNRVCVDPSLTPYLYKLSKQGINIDGFDTPATQGSTSDSEFRANTSLDADSSNGATCYTYPYNTYKTTLPSLFKENGYNTIAYHNLYGQYYNRSVNFPLLGYDRFFDCSDFGLNDLLPDSYCADVISWNMVTDNKTMAYWITYSGHQPYEYGSCAVDENDVALIREKYPELSEDFVSYFAKNMDLDHAIETLFNTLEMTGKLDNTVIFLFGDHVVKFIHFEDDDYYEQTGNQKKGDETYTDLYIYNSEIEGFRYEKASSLLDLLPTVANLWGFDYDDTTVLGRDIFDESYHGYSGGIWNKWKTDNYYYDFQEDTFEFINDYDPAIAREEMDYYLKLIDYSKRILKLDYFSR